MTSIIDSQIPGLKYTGSIEMDQEPGLRRVDASQAPRVAVGCHLRLKG